MGIVTKTIGTSSRDYSTIQSWEDALPANLVTDGNSQVGQLFNDSEFVFSSGTVLTIGGETTSSTFTITLTTGSGQSFIDNAGVQTNPVRYDQSKGVGISVGHANGISWAIPNVTVEKIQIKGTSSYSGVLIQNSGTGGILQNCIIQNNTGSYGGTPVGVTDSAGHTGGIIRNCVIITNLTGGGIAFGNAGLGHVANCTIVRPSDGSHFGAGIGLQTGVGNGHYGGVNTVKNTAVFGFATFADDLPSWGSSNNNATDLASTTVPGSSNQVSLTYSSQFVALTLATMDFKTKTGATLLDNAATDTGGTGVPAAIDIVGTARPQGSSWDIGAWELVVSGGGVSGTLATTEAADVAAFNATFAVTGTLATTEAQDVAAFNATFAVIGTLATTEAQDVAAFNATFAITGTLNTTEAKDTAAFNATFAITGTLNTTESQDVAAFTGSGVTPTGTLAAIEAPDTAAFVGTVGVAGTLNTTEARDTASFTGTVSGIPSGVLAATEAPDVASISGVIVIGPASGYLAATEAQDIVHIVGPGLVPLDPVGVLNFGRRVVINRW